jgi:tetratricopeptide (TPR) repeat protein
MILPLTFSVIHESMRIHRTENLNMSQFLLIGGAIAQLLLNTPFGSTVVPQPVAITRQSENKDWLEIGSQRYLSNDFYGAIGAYTEGINIKPTVPLLMGRSLAWSKVDHPQRAIADLNSAIALDRNRGILYTMRGTVYMRLNDRENAIRDMNQGVRLTPNGNAYLSRGIMHLNFGNLAAAREDLNTAAQLFKQIKDPYWYNQVMRVLGSI